MTKTFAVSLDGGKTYVETPGPVDVRVLDVTVGEIPCQLSYLFDPGGLIVDLYRLDEEGYADEIIGTEPGDLDYDEIAQELFEVGP